MTVKRSSLYYFLFCLILSWDTWLHYVISLPVKYSDVTNVLTLIFIILYLLDNRFAIQNIKPLFLFVLIVLTSSIMANVLLGQSFMDGFLVCRHMYIQYAIIIPLMGLIGKGYLDRENLIRGTLRIIRFACILYVLHYIFYEFFGLELLNMSASGTRYDSARFYFVLIMPTFLLMNAASNVFNLKVKIVDLFDILIVGFLMIQVGKMRMTTLSSLVAVFIGLMLTKKMGLKKIGLLSAGFIALVVLLNYTSMGQDLLDVVFGKKSLGSDGIRQIGRILHIKSFLKSPIFGLGYPHENCAAAMAEFGTIRSYMVSGTQQTVYIGDNGIFDFLYIFGLSGVIWLIYVFGGFLIKGYKMMCNTGYSAYITFTLAMVIQIYTELNWFFCGMLFIGIFSALLYTDESSDYSDASNLNMYPEKMV